jgi:hypothetical protein
MKLQAISEEVFSSFKKLLFLAKGPQSSWITAG